MAQRSPTTLVAVYAAVALSLLALDMVWLLLIATPWYLQGMGHLMAAEPNWVAAGLFYLLYPVGVVVFAVLPGARGSVRTPVLMGGLFGLFCYGTYDLTNLALLKDWPTGLTVLDIAWGSVVSGAAAAAGALLCRYRDRSLTPPPR